MVCVANVITFKVITQDTFIQVYDSVSLLKDKDHLQSQQWKLKRELDNVERKFEAKSQVLKKLNDDKAYGKANKVFTIKRDTILTELEMIDKELKLIHAEKKAQSVVQHKQDWENLKLEISACEDKNYRLFIKEAGRLAVKHKQSHFFVEDFINKFLEYSNEELDVHACLKLCRIRASWQFKQTNNPSLHFISGYCGVDYGTNKYDSPTVSIRFGKELAEL